MFFWDILVVMKAVAVGHTHFMLSGLVRQIHSGMHAQDPFRTASAPLRVLSERRGGVFIAEFSTARGFRE